MADIELDGVQEALRNLRRYLAPERNRVMMKAYRDAANFIKRLAKTYTHRQSGTLSKSITIKVKMYPNGNIVALIGPKSWYIGNYKGVKRIAHKYAHLVEKGRKGFRQKYIIKSTGTYAVRFVKPAPPYPFIGKSVRNGGRIALQLIEERIATGLGK